MGYVGKHGVEALKRYKYSGVNRSYLAKYVLTPFWKWAVNFFPLWMPPNGITLMGFLFVVTSSLLSYIYTPHLDTPAPRWVCFAHGILLFLYQLFDEVDGKQARRTNSSSPLGELFDHGCDALTCGFETMAFGASVMSGRNCLWFWAIATIPFFGSTWETFFTDSLTLPVVNGPTEGLLLIYGIHIFTAIVGPPWWTKNFRDAVPILGVLPFVPDMSMNVFIIWSMMIFAVVPTFGGSIYNILKVVKGRGDGVVGALAMGLPFVGLLGGVVTWAAISPSDILATQPHLVLTGSGFAFGFIVGRLILAHLCEETKGLKRKMSATLIYLPFAIANAFSAKLWESGPLVDELVVLFGYVAFTSSVYSHFAVRVIQEITTALGIYCFSITKDHMENLSNNK